METSALETCGLWDRRYSLNSSENSSMQVAEDFRARDTARSSTDHTIERNTVYSLARKSSATCIEEFSEE